jgi:hypothetical protein
MVAEMPLELIQEFDFKIQRFEYFQTEFLNWIQNRIKSNQLLEKFQN